MNGLKKTCFTNSHEESFLSSSFAVFDVQMSADFPPVVQPKLCLQPLFRVQHTPLSMSQHDMKVGTLHSIPHRTTPACRRRNPPNISRNSPFAPEQNSHPTEMLLLVLLSIILTIASSCSLGRPSPQDFLDLGLTLPNFSMEHLSIKVDLAPSKQKPEFIAPEARFCRLLGSWVTDQGAL